MMPFLNEGDSSIGLRAASGMEAPNPIVPGIGETAVAAFKHDNPMTALFMAARRESYPPEPGHNPLDVIRDTKYEANYLDNFVSSRSEAETRAIMRRIDEEEENQRTLEASGGVGVIAGIAAGLIDPTIALPGGTIYRSAKGGYSVMKSARSVALAGAAQVAAQEAALQGVQETRTAAESTMNIASAAILSGILGAGAIGLLSRAERKILERGIDADRAFVDAHAEGRPVPRPGDDLPADAKAKIDELAAKAVKENPNMTAEQAQTKAVEIWDEAAKQAGGAPSVTPEQGGGAVPQAAGAAVSDTRTLERVKIVPDAVREIPGVAYAVDRIGALVDRFNPMSRLLASRSATARRAAADLAETPLRFEQNFEGLPTTNGPALDRIARLVINQTRVAVADEMDRLFSEYRFQRPDVTLPRMRAQFEQFMGRGEGFMTNAEFRAEVAKALSQGDKHDVPQVALAAQFIRARVFEPWKQRAIKAGLFPEDMGVTGAESYFQRVYRKKEIAARRPEFVDRVLNYLKRDQETKAAAKERLESLNGQINSWQAHIAKLEARLQRLDRRGDVLMGRLTEREMEVRRGEQRADALEKRSAAIAEEISEIEEFVAFMKQEVQDPALRDQIKMLEKDVSDLRKQDRPLTEAQLRQIEDEELQGILTAETRLGAEMLTGRRNFPKVPSFLSYFVTNGGINDAGGEVRAIVGGASARPGLINNKAGRSVDAFGEKLANDFPQHFPNGRPSENEVLRMIDEASRGRPPHWWMDEMAGNNRQLMDAAKWALAFDEVLTRAGVEVKTTRDVAKILRDGRTENGVTLDDLDKIAADMEAAGESIPASIRVKAAEMELGDAREGLASLRSTLARARADRARQAQNLRVADARKDEADFIARQSRGRLGILEDQLSRAEFKRELIEEALAIAGRHHDELRAKIEAELGAWEGKSAAEAKSAIKAREKYAAKTQRAKDAPRLRAADDTIDRVVKRILASNRDLDDLELRARAEEITNRILGSPDGRLPYDVHEGGPEIGWKAAGEPPRGPLARRDFAIPDDEIREFLEDDAEQVVAMHLRTIVPDVLLTERFGDVRMTETFRKIDEDYNALARAASSAKERAAIEKERQAAIRDIAAIRDRVRSVYGWSQDSIMQNAARYAAAAKNYNVLTSMGMAGVSSLPDMAGVVFRYGFSKAFSEGWRPFFSYLTGKSDAWKVAKEQYRAMGIATEMALNTRRNALDDIGDVYQPQSRFERTLHHGADAMMIANMQAPFTDWAKTTASIVAGNDILRATKAVAEGRATKKQIAQLAESNIDAATATKIWKQFQTGGEVRDGVYLPNTADWTDAAARLAFEGAVAREADIAVVTPGQEKSLWLSQPVIGAIGQFKSFTGSATERILIANLQRSDANTLQGLVFSLGLGMLSYKLNSLAGGVQTSDRPQDWIKEGISRSGVMGWFEEGNAVASKVSRGSLDVFRLIGADKPLSRYVSRSGIDAFLGPTAGKVNNIVKVLGAAGGGEWTGSDSRALRQLIAYQNLVWLRGALNQVERASNDMFGIENLPER